MTRTRIGLGIVGLMILIALFGPLIAPHSPTEFVAAPNSKPSSTALFGADAGPRRLEPLLNGGTVLWMAAAATAFGIVVGTVVGLVAAYSRGWLDDVLMRSNDVLLAFPQIVFVLLAVSAVGPKLWLIVLTVGLTHAPRVARVMRARRWASGTSSRRPRRWARSAGGSCSASSCPTSRARCSSRPGCA